MTATQVQIRRDTAANLNAATPAAGELGWDTTNKRLVGGDGSRLGGHQIPSFTDIQKQGFVYATAAGTADVRTLTLAPVLLAYGAGNGFEFLSAAANTGAVTMNVNGLGAKNVYKIKNGTLTALEAGDIISGGIYRITYDGTQFQIKSLDEAEGSLAGWTLLSVATGGGGSYDFTSGIDSTYKNYAFVIDNLLPTSNNVALCARVRRSGQGSFDSSGGNYQFNGGSAGGETYIQFMTGAKNAAGNGFGVSGIVYGHGLALSNYSLLDGNTCHATLTGGAPTESNSHGSGLRITTTALDGVQFFFSGGSISSGDIYLYGLKSSL